MPLGNYFSYPGAAAVPPRLPASGLGESLDIAAISRMGSAGWIGWGLKFALKVGCGYYIGQFFNHPVAGAALTGFFGLPGLVALALVSDAPAVAIANRRRRRHRRRRGYARRSWRRGGGR